MNYAAPLQVYGDLSNSLSALPSNSPPAVICVGKEWYRFPSSFFLPDERFQLSFVHDGPVRTLVHSFTDYAIQTEPASCDIHLWIDV